MSGRQVVSPRTTLVRQPSKRRRTPGANLQQLLGTLLQPTLPESVVRRQQYAQELERLSTTAISWTTQEEWVVELPRPLRHVPRDMTPEAAAFWPTFSWADNSWILDRHGHVLQPSKYDKIRPCTIEALRVIRVGINTYTFALPTTGARMHQQAKLRRWGLAILLSAPSMEIGGGIQVTQELRTRILGDTPHRATLAAACTTFDPGQQGVIALEQIVMGDRLGSRCRQH